MEFYLKVFLTATLIINVIVQACEYGFVENNKTCTTCGRGPVKRAKRIIGGKEVVPHSWPAHIFIQQYYNVDYEYEKGKTFNAFWLQRCGGTLINDRTILTAAHCMKKTFTFEKFNKEWTIPIVPTKHFPTWESTFTITAGAHNISFVKTGDIPSTVRIGMIDQIIHHPSFNPNSLENDIAIIRLKRRNIFSNAMPKTKEIDYSCLPKVDKTNLNNIPLINQKCDIVGWGRLHENHTIADGPDVLNGVEIDVLSMNDCLSTQRSLRKNYDSQICAGDMLGKRDSCLGDSGGGLYWYDKGIKKYVVVGITSYGEGCGRIRKPGIYTRVSHFFDWIKKNM